MVINFSQTLLEIQVLFYVFDFDSNLFHSELKIKLKRIFIRYYLANTFLSRR